MSFFSRSNKSANSSAASSLKDKDAPAPTHEIFTSPPDGVVPTLKRTYDEGQLKQIEELKQYTSTLLLPSSDPYHAWESRFLSDPGCHPRYMRAAKWKLDDAKRRIKGTLEWRREFKPELIKPGDVSVEAETGKIIVSGFDMDARPVIYMRPGRENTEPTPRQIRHLIFHLERAIDLAPPGQEQVAIIVDYKSATSQSNPSFGTARHALNILQNHYVERLGRGLVVNMPWWMNAFFSALTPLMDPITRDKVRMNPKLTELVPAAQLDYEFGGQHNLDFKHAVYWKTLTEFCHLAEDGSRIDNNGQSWVPPLGNGIKAASEGLVPKAGAVASGEVEKAGNGGSGGETAPQGQSEAQKFAADHSPAEERTEHDATHSTTGLENGMAGMAVGGAGATSTSTPATHDSTAGTTEGAEPEPPTSATKPGPPAGDLAFDHPPSKEEKKQAEEIIARASMDGR